MKADVVTSRTAGDLMVNDVIANPADDGLRLIFADWLDDNGQMERAEFIRVQIALDPIRRNLWPDDYEGNAEVERLERREKELFSIAVDAALHASTRLWDEWLPDLIGGWSPNALHGDDRSYLFMFRRGFISEIRCLHNAWLEYGQTMVLRHPIERAVLTDCEPTACIVDMVETAIDGVSTHRERSERFLWGDWPHDEPRPSESHYLSLIASPIRAKLPHGFMHKSRIDALEALYTAALGWEHGKGRMRA